MKKILNKIKNYDFVCLICFILLGIWQVIRCPDLPGVYFDAVNPDYLAVQILFPGVPNTNWALGHSGIPLLGQFYHGTITIWLQILLIGLFGKADMLTLRLANVAYVIGICWVIHLILKKLGVNRILSFFMVNMILLSPQVFSFIRTQYYIKLPGALLLMLSIYFAILTLEKDKHAFYLALSGAALGLAFYSYFIYLFFAPAVLVFCLYRTKKLGLKYFRDMFVWCMGFCTGGVLYVIGYGDFIITSTGLSMPAKKVIVVMSGILLSAAMIVLLYMLVRGYDEIKTFRRCSYFVVGLFFSLGVLVIINLNYIIELFVPGLTSLEIAGSPMGLFQRIIRVCRFWRDMMSNRFSEKIMLGTTTGFLPFYYAALFVFLLGIACILGFAKKIEWDKWIEILIWCNLLLCYGILCVPFITRMDGQHFTPVFFITFTVLIILADRVWEKLQRNIAKKTFSLLLGFALFLSIMNSNLLQRNLEFTGGRNMFSEEINILAENALVEHGEGQKVIYCFPEWGFMCGFNYLTMNQVPYILDVDVNILKEYLDQGYSFKICTWDYGNVSQYFGEADQYVEILNNAGITNLSIEEIRSREGEIVFYIIQGT